MRINLYNFALYNNNEAPILTRQTIYFGAISQLKLIYYVCAYTHGQGKKMNLLFRRVNAPQQKSACTHTHTHTLAVYPLTTTPCNVFVYASARSYVFFSHIIIRGTTKEGLKEREREREDALGIFVKCENHTTL